MTEKNFIPKELHVKFTALAAKDVTDIEETEAPETIGLSGGLCSIYFVRTVAWLVSLFTVVFRQESLSDWGGVGGGEDLSLQSWCFSIIYRYCGTRKSEKARANKEGTGERKREIVEDAYSWLVPGVQIVERGWKIDEEKKRGETREGKGEETLEGSFSLVPVSPRFSPLVFLACDFTRSTPSENRTLCTIWTP